MKNWIQKHPKESAIGAGVLVVHLFFMFYNFKTPSTPCLPKESIVVNTRVQLKPKIKLQPKPHSVNKKTQPVSQMKKKKEKNVLKELEQNLENLKQQQQGPDIRTSLTFPNKIQKLNIDQISEDLPKEENIYLSLLVKLLQQKLKLPEEGNVRLQLTVLKSGRVEKVQVLYTESENNKCYLERALIHLTLPPFSDELAKKIEHTFTLNFCYEQ